MNESLSKELSKQGIENSIYSFSLQYPSFLFPGETQFETSSLGPENISIRSTINSINPFTWWNTARLIRKENPDFVVIRFWLPFMALALGTIAKWVRKGSSTKVIGLCDNVIPHEKRIGDKWLTQFFIDRCDSYVVMSSSVLEELNQFDIDKPRKLLYHPVYDHFGDEVDKAMARKHLGLSNNHKIILFFGMIRKYKGLKLLLKAVAEMDNRDNLKVLVAGEFYDDKTKYVSLIKKLGLEDTVILHARFVDKNKVKYYFSAADIVAQPYLSATQSGVTQIAYHFQTPMLVSNVGGLAEMVPHNKVGYVVEPDKKEIASALDSFFQQNLYQEFKDNIKEESKRFEWAHFATEIAAMA